MVGSETALFIRLMDNFFTIYYSLLTFLQFEQHIFAEFTNCFHISSYYSLLTFFQKNNPKNWEFTIYLLDPPTYELGTFSAKISHHAKNKYYGSSIQITACLNLRRS